MNKIAVITSKIGNREGGSLIEPPIKYDGVDYHAFVDFDPYNSSWQIHKYLDFSSDKHFKDRRNAKIYKILPFLFLPNYDYYFWIDSTHVLVRNPIEIIEEIHSDFAVFNHAERQCVYDESNAVKSLGYDYTELIDKQMWDYRMNNYPEKNGLYELPCFIIKNTNLTKETCLMWWEHICKYTSRDQLSLPYILWYKNLKPQILEGNVRILNNYFNKVKATTPSTRI
jgi:hypothetical protein